jgi:hypothetical protein
VLAVGSSELAAVVEETSWALEWIDSAGGAIRDGFGNVLFMPCTLYILARCLTEVDAERFESGIAAEQIHREVLGIIK